MASTWVVGGLLDELDDCAERLIRVVDQDVLLADRREHALAPGQSRAGIWGSNGGSFKSRKPSILHRLPGARQIDRAGNLVNVAIFEVESRG